MAIAPKLQKLAGGGDQYLEHNIFFGNGRSFHQMENLGFGGNDTEYDSHFTTADGSSAKFHFSKGKIQVDCGDRKATYTEVGSSAETALRTNAQFKALPKLERQEYLYRVKDTNRYIYVTSPKLESSYKNWKFWEGEPGKMKSLPIESVKRARDGGTTDITLVDGKQLFSPSPFAGSSKTPNFDGKPLEVADASILKSLKVAAPPSAKFESPCDVIPAGKPVESKTSQDSEKGKRAK